MIVLLTLILITLNIIISNFSMFKEKFKYYKSRCPLPTYENVEDFHKVSEKLSDKVVQRMACSTTGSSCLSKYGLIDIKLWKIYEFKAKSGLIFIVNPFTSQGQQYWVQRCLQEYTKKPNKLNLDPFNHLQPGENWWEKAQTGSKEENLLKKLRWATLGYHHNWDTKEYSDADRSDFPPELAELSRVVIEAIGEPSHQSFHAEAAIVNFYHFDSTLSGHKDVSEPNMESPLLSISFGQSAIFLVGGESLDDPVTAMFIHSGDMVVMSGRSRGFYHGVPRIIPTTQRPWAGNGWEESNYGKYLETSRINVNIRQVLLPKQNCIKI